MTIPLLLGLGRGQDRSQYPARARPGAELGGGRLGIRISARRGARDTPESRARARTIAMAMARVRVAVRLGSVRGAALAIDRDRV